MKAEGYKAKCNPFLLTDVQPRDSRIDAQLRLIEEKATEGLKKHPNDAKQLFARSQARMKLGELELALGDISKHLLLQQQSVNGYYLRGCIYQKLRKVNEAIKDFTYVLEKDPNHFNAQVARASCFNFLGDFDTAIKEYQVGLTKSSRVIRTVPSDTNEKSLDLANSSNLSDIAESLMALSPTNRTRPPIMRLSEQASSVMGKYQTLTSPQSTLLQSKMIASPKSALSFGTSGGLIKAKVADTGKQTSIDE